MVHILGSHWINYIPGIRLQNVILCRVGLETLPTHYRETERPCVTTSVSAWVKRKTKRQWKPHLHMANVQLREINVIWVFVTMSVQVYGANILLMHRWSMDTQYRWVTGCVYRQRPITAYLTPGMSQTSSNQTGTHLRIKYVAYFVRDIVSNWWQSKHWAASARSPLAPSHSPI